MKSDLGSQLLNKIPNFALILSCMIVLTILCFIFPEYLTTPEIRSKYPIPFFRKLILICQIVAAVAAVFSLIFLSKPKLSILSLILLALSMVPGGSEVYLKEEYDSFPIRIGLDWFILDLFIVALLFIPLEAIFPRHKSQKIVRAEFYTDLFYFGFTHLAVQFILLMTQVPADILLEYIRLTGQKLYVGSLHMAVQVLIALFIADLVQYTMHRALHASKKLWEIHKIHHSIKTLDWLSGSRLHVVEIVVMRFLVYTVISYLGLSTMAFTIYLSITAFQTMFIHANIGLNLGFFKYLIVTPQYHHWHHNDQPETYDKNFCIHFPVIDMMFGTFYLPEGKWPLVYGIENYPVGIFKQFIEPFRRIFR